MLRQGSSDVFSLTHGVCIVSRILTNLIIHFHLYGVSGPADAFVIEINMGDSVDLKVKPGRKNYNAVTSCGQVHGTNVFRFSSDLLGVLDIYNLRNLDDVFLHT